MKQKIAYIILLLGLLTMVLAAGCAERISSTGTGNIFGRGSETSTPTPVPTTEQYPDVTVRISGQTSGSATGSVPAPVTTTVPSLKEVYKGLFNLSYATYTHVELDYRLEQPPLIITAVFTPKEIKRVIVTTSDYGKKEEIRITTGHVTADTRAVITVKDAATGEVILKDGYRGVYSAESKKEMRVLKSGNLTVEVDGLDVEVNLLMQVYE